MTVKSTGFDINTMLIYLFFNSQTNDWDDCGLKMTKMINQDGQMGLPNIQEKYYRMIYSVKMIR